MTYHDLILKEKQILKQIYLYEKFWDYHKGKSLKERTSLDNSIFERLDLFCKGKEFLQNLNSNHYCSLASYSNKEINCPYLSKSKDHNHMRACTYNQFPAFSIHDGKIELNNEEFKEQMYDDLFKRNIIAMQLNNNSIRYLKPITNPTKKIKHQDNFKLEEEMLDDIMENNQIYYMGDNNTYSDLILGTKLK